VQELRERALETGLLHHVLHLGADACDLPSADVVSFIGAFERREYPYTDARRGLATGFTQPRSTDASQSATAASHEG
jgi:hypothetical protein